MVAVGKSKSDGQKKLLEIRELRDEFKYDQPLWENSGRLTGLYRGDIAL